MARKDTPTVQGGLALVNTRAGAPDAERVIVVGTGAWYAWLDQAKVFIFADDLGSFTARKERFQRGGWYWRAYRRRFGRLRRTYLGKSERLSLDCLESAARRLASGNHTPGSAEPMMGAKDLSRTQTAKEDLIALGLQVDPPHGPERPGASHERTYLMATKLSVPVPPRDLLSRQRLTDTLQRSVVAPVTVIIAPAGSGKTTLLAEWAAACAPCAGWVALDHNDNDPVRFWQHALAALDLAVPGLTRTSRSVLDAGGSKAIDMALAALANALVGRTGEPIHLVLDDYHEIESQPIHESLSLLVEYAPEALRVILASREELPEAFAGLIVDAKATVLPEAALRFTEEESLAFLNAHAGPHAGSVGVRLLAEGIEGWAAGLRLTTLAMGEGAVAPGEILTALTRGEHHALSAYLAEEVLRRSPAPVYVFLLETSILDRLCGPLCDAVTGRTDGQEMLDQLDRARLFLTPLGLEHHWYRHHPLFAAFLRARLHTRDTVSESVLHKRAAIWLEAHGEAEEAIKHALAARDTTLAALLIETHGLELYRRGETAAVVAWLDALPLDIVRQRPQLALLHAQSLLVLGRTEDAESLVVAAEQSLASDSCDEWHENDGQSEHQRLRGEALAARAAIMFSHGDYPAATVAYQQALLLIPKTNTTLRATVTSGLGVMMATSGRLRVASEAQRTAYAAYQASGDLAGMLESLWILGSMLFSLGELSAAARALRGVIDLADSGSGNPLAAASGAYYYLSRVYYEWDRRAEAAPLVETSLRLNARNGDAGLEVRALLLLGRLRNAAADDDGVRICIRRVEKLQRTPGVRRGVTELAGAVSARLALTIGDVEAAGAWAREAGLDVKVQLGYQNEFSHLTFVRLLLAEGRVEEAVYFLGRLHADAAPTERVDKQIEVGILEALALQAQGNWAGALVALRAALTQAEPGGYMRLFMDEGSPMIALLAQLGHEKKRAGQVAVTSPTYLARLLAAAFGVPAVGTDQNSLTAAHTSSLLSQREMEIVRLIAAGMSNIEIARDLIVEPSTVKWHIHNILEKLGAHNRTGALARAQALGLV